MSTIAEKKRKSTSSMSTSAMNDVLDALDTKLAVSQDPYAPKTNKNNNSQSMRPQSAN